MNLMPRLFRWAIYRSFLADFLRHAFGLTIARILHFGDGALKLTYWIVLIGLLAGLAELLGLLTTPSEIASVLEDWRPHIAGVVAVLILGPPGYWVVSRSIKWISALYVGGLLGYLIRSDVPTAVHVAAQLDADKPHDAADRFFGSVPDWLVVVTTARGAVFLTKLASKVVAVAESRLVGEPDDSPVRLSLRRLARAGSLVSWLDRYVPDLSSDWTAGVIADAIDQKDLVV